MPTDDQPEATDTSEVYTLRARVEELQAQLMACRAGQSGGAVAVSDAQALEDLGIYQYNHPLDSAVAYKDRLSTLQGRVAEMARQGQAILATDMFTWNGSLARGRQLVRDLSKLMLRAYNSEADNCVRALRSGNLATAVRRLDRSVEGIEKLGTMMELRINPDYHRLRIEELELVSDYQMKVQQEREAAREQRELLREQRRAEQELAEERARLDKERAHYAGVLAGLRARGDESAAAELEQRLTAIDEAIAANDYRTANIRAGYVYVISNIGAFGPNMVKIGLTRRLEPYDRIRELSGASVPFTYDVHALFFSEDAVTLENELHKHFADRRVNWINNRREFFFATPEQVKEVLAQRVGNLLEYAENPEAIEYRQSKASWPQVMPLTTSETSN